MPDGLIIDSFAGGGGASTGIEWALGRSPDFAINHDPEALAMHAANHPNTVHLTENIWKVDPAAVTKGKPVFLLWASPDCRDFSKAKGGAPTSKSVRGLANVVIYWAKVARPQIILLENVEEFAQWGPVLPNGRPCPARRGMEFARWVRALEAEGYQVEWAESRACNKGAPTIRKRLYLCARRDNKPIIIPPVTHQRADHPDVKAGNLAPWRTAAEIIDWHLPCPSIFLTKAEAKEKGLKIQRPLAAKTMSRIARGFKRYVLDRADPFVVTCNHSGAGFRGQGLDQPLNTVAAARDAHGLVSPYLAGVGGRMGQSGERPADAPYHTVCTKPDTVIVTPYMAVNRFDATGRAIDEPMPTITANSFVKRPGAGGPLSVVAPYMSYAQQGGANRAADDPMHTVCASRKDQNQVVTGLLVPRYGEAEGQEPRSRDVLEPAPTIVPTGNGGDLAAVYLAQHNGGERAPTGRAADAPAGTITTEGSQIQPVMAYLSALQNNTVRGDIKEPLGTVLADGQHHSIVLPFTSTYYGVDQAPEINEPLATVTTKDRFAHIEAPADAPPLADWQIDRARAVAEFLRAEGVWRGGEFVTVGTFIVWDIGMRMLTPRELARAQGFPDTYDITAGSTLTETAQRHKIGNSVSPYEAASWAWWNCVHALTLPDVKRKKRAVLPVFSRAEDNPADMFEEAAA
ncbi:MAG: DNA cytosine methyltransferase [Proteobacteria bacterium]|nr:DNA cytosine methyltransferase [Pseudomonadota bacterium]